MLGRHYISINSTQLPNPTKFKIGYRNIENIKTSEAGDDVGTVTRLLKRTFNATYQCTSGGRDRLKAFCALNSVSMTYNGESITARARFVSEDLAENSEYASRTDGLWTVSVQFLEE